MKRLAWRISVMGFFALAIVGLVSGLSIHVCALKALGGAVALYVLMRVAGRLTAGILADVIIRHLSEQGTGRNRRGERRGQ